MSDERRLNQVQSALDAHAAAAGVDRRRWALSVRSSLGAMLRAAAPPEGFPPVAAPDDRSIEAVLESLRTRAPRAFEVWREAFEENREEYAVAERRCASLSVPSNPGAEAFAEWVQPLLRGRVLDVGCGPQPVPVYLERHPPEWCAGIDPLPPFDEHPFVFRRALCEAIPWPDRCFESVVCATSLDHVLDLDRSLDEVCRVLVPGGLFLLWVAFVPGSVRYDLDRVTERLDRFHLFHFDRPWFYPLILRRFEIIEDWALDSQSRFLCLRPLSWSR
jgi:SAM-dependent methyltransferase